MFNRLTALHPALKGVPLLGIVLVSGIIGYGVGVKTTIQPSSMGELVVTASDRERVISEDIDFTIYWEIFDTIKKNYYNQPVSDAELFYGSLRGLVEGLGDPYSTFLTPRDANEFSDELSGNFSGIGAEIGIRGEQLTIITPLTDTPAERAGLKAGDAIFAIDGIDTTLLSIDESVSRIRGKKGTQVVLTVRSNGDTAVRDIAVVRDDIHVNSVTTEYDEASNLYLLKIHSFNTDTAMLVREAALDILTRNPRGIILDLRNNPGGFLDSAVKVAGYWTGDDTVVREIGSGLGENTYEAGIDPILKAVPTVVLINGGSASASEIVAGALQDYGYAMIVGEQSFGKGTVQILEELRGGAAIKYTVAEWLTPNGRSIEDNGVTPDRVVPLTEEDFLDNRDPQLDEARSLLP